MTTWRRGGRIGRPGIFAAVFVVLLTAAACGDDASPPTLGPVDDAVGGELPDATVLGSYVGDVALPDVSAGGAPFALRADDGGALVVYFGFTSCPDVCPTTLSDLRRALEQMGEDAGRVDVAMVTIDPARDLDATIAAYLGSFIDGGHPLRTDDDSRLRGATDAFGADYSVITTAEGDIDVQHTAYLYAVDDEGEIAIVWPFGAEPDRIAVDLAALLEAA